MVLATPHSAHLPETLAAARAGKHVFLEKPMGLNVAECRQMIDACQAAGVKLTVGHVTRRMEAARVAKRLVDAGRIGDVRMIQAWRALSGGLPFPEGSWAVDPKEGGAFLDWGSHGCDVVRWFAGSEPVLAFGHSTKFDPAEQVAADDLRPVHVRERRFGHIWMTYELPHVGRSGRGPVHHRRLEGHHRHHRLRPGLLSNDDGWDVVYRSSDWVSADDGWGYPSGYMRDGFARQVQDFADAIAEGRRARRERRGRPAGGRDGRGDRAVRGDGPGGGAAPGLRPHQGGRRAPGSQSAPGR